MPDYSVAFIGTGPNPETPVWGKSAAMAYRHAASYRMLDQCELVACADLVRDHAESFATEFSIDHGHVYEDYTKMLVDANPDVVSICTPVPTHSDIVIDCARTGNLQAIHCEKPMATTWGDCKRMARTCDEHDIQLTFNHQRRFDERCREAKRLLKSGAIGDLERVEMGGKNIFDFGSHLVDLCNFFNGECPAEWVLGQIDYRTENVRYGAHNENQAIAQWRYENGVHGLAATGQDGLVGCNHRLVGSDGEIELLVEDGPDLRVRRTDGSSETFDVEVASLLDCAIEHIIESLDADVESELSAAKAMRASEIIFGVWESSRRRGRVDLPLDVDDNPLEAMVESGALTPAPVGEESS